MGGVQGAGRWQRTGGAAGEPGGSAGGAPCGERAAPGSGVHARALRGSEQLCGVLPRVGKRGQGTNGAPVGAAVFCANNSMLHSFRALASMLPPGQLFTLSEFHSMDSMSANGPDDLEQAMLGFALGGYHYETYKFGSACKAATGSAPPATWYMADSASSTPV